ncbi:MAG: SDR family NAD(P)-dependent oxidoreductase [Lautropia sp.]
MPTEPRAGRLEGRVAFIAGAATGIGRAAALMFAREGASVVVADIDRAGGEDVARRIASAGGSAHFVFADVRDEPAVAAAAESARQAFGRVHVLFNCAGGSLPQDGPVTESDPATWARTLELDLRGTMLTCRHLIPMIVASGGGAVVNMSSGAALRGSNRAHAYSAAKGAIVSLTRALAGSHATDGVRVNAICAGRVNAERVRTTYGLPGRPGTAHDPMKVDEQVKAYPFWLGEPDDIAHVALFLASDESRMITGAAIPADGGRSAY